MWNIAYTENCEWLVATQIVNVCALPCICGPLYNESQFWAGSERDDELSKLAIVLLFNPRIGQLQRG